ncbi:alpha/beta-hydrolase [Russula earlei]|uniref:Alpha/beta-hydrolase n=1 Tax=Russula earlei TaxID=71964 RepID=A0ACC0TZP3_9AGAM|nr:alpha/beta-hydrolase [Russula earlei]
MSFCKDCISGARHEGTAEGTYEVINGIKTYVATPKTDYPKDRTILYLTDVFGLELPNNPLLCDDFAHNGFKVYAPDLFEGDPVAADALNPGSTFDLYAWIPKHTPEHTGKRVRKLIEGLKEQGAVASQIYIAKSKAPLLINSCEFDELFPLSLGKTADEKFANFAPGYLRNHAEGVHHGFATRGDLRDPVIQAAKENAFLRTVEWFIKYMP